MVDWAGDTVVAARPTPDPSLALDEPVVVRLTSHGEDGSVSVDLTESTARMLVAFLEATVGSAGQIGATP